MKFNKTKYMIYAHKGVDFLLYKKSYTLFWFIKWHKWLLIPYPNERGKVNVVCSKIPEFKNIKKFIMKYPDINEYLKYELPERKNKFK